MARQGGTSLVEDLRPGPAPDPLAGPPAESALLNLKELVAFRDRLFFRTSDDTTGSELWVSDGSDGGTGLAIDIMPGADSGDPGYFTLFDGNLYLAANSPEYGSSAYYGRRGELFRLNEAPYAFDMAGVTAIDTQLGVSLLGLDLDGDSLTFEILDPPAHGIATINGSTVTYTPDTGFAGVDHFTYRALDGSLYSQAASAEIGVTASTNTASFAQAGASIPEQSGIHRVSVVLAQAAAADLFIPFTIEGDAAVENDNLREGTLFIPAGATGGEILVNLSDDTRYETEPQLMELTLRANSAIALGGISQYVLALQDNDPLPMVQFVSPWMTVAESNDTIRIDVGLSAASDETVSVNVRISHLTNATWNVDFFASLDNVIEFLPGQMRKSVFVRLADDALPEPRETIFAQLQSPVGATVTSDPARFRYLTWIADNDTSVVSMSPAVRLQSEGDVVTLEATRTGGNLANALSVPVIVDLYGASASDYSLSGLSFQFAPNATTATLTATLTDDGTAENFEALSVRLDTGTFERGDVTSTHIGIYDNDLATIELTIGNTNAPGVTSPKSVSEQYPHGGGLNWLIDVTATLSLPMSTELSVPFVINSEDSEDIGGYATRGADFLLSSANFVFPPGVTSVTRTLEILDDVKVERDEVIHLALKPTAEQFSLRRQGIIDDGSLWKKIEIRDNEEGVSISAPKSVSESDGQFKFTVSLTKQPASLEIVHFSLSGTAEREIDYTIPAALVNSNGLIELHFDPDHRTRDIVVNVIDNDVFGGNSELTLTQLHYQGANLRAGTARTVNIQDDEAPPKVTFDHRLLTVSENEVIPINIELSRESSLPIELTFNFRGSAKLNEDFVILDASHKFANNVLTIPAGVTSARIRFKVLDVTGDRSIVADVSGKGIYNRLSFSDMFQLIQARRRGLDLPGTGFTIIVRDRDKPPAAESPSRPTSDTIQTSVTTATVGTLAIDTAPLLGSAASNSTAISGSNGNATDLEAFLAGTVLIGAGSQGLLQGAVVFFDANFNFVRDFLDLDADGRQDPGEPLEPQVNSDLDGSFAIEIASEFDVDGNGLIDTSEGRFVLSGGIDTSTGLPWSIPMAAPVGSLIVNPINTLVENLARRHGLTVEEARERTGDALGIAGYDFARGNAIYGILADDPISISAYLQQVQISSAVIQIASLASAVSELGMSLHADEVYNLLGDQLAASGSTLDLANEGLVHELVGAVNARLSAPLAADVIDGAAELIALGASKIQEMGIAQFATPEDLLNEITRAKKLMFGEIATALADVGAGTRTIASVLDDYTGATAPNFDSRMAAQTIGQVIPTVVGVSDAYVFEGDSGQKMAQFTVEIVGTHSAPVSVAYATFDNSALAADGDYTPVSGTLTWAVGDMDPKTILVPVHGDSVSEADEEFSVLLSNVQNAVIRIAEGVGFIVNDDGFVYTAAATPGSPTEMAVIHSRDTALFWADDSLVFGGYFADDLTATLNGQATEANRFELNFAAATYRGDHYVLHGGASVDSMSFRGGRFSTITHEISSAANSNGSTDLLSELGPELHIDWTSIENTRLVVSAVDELSISFPFEVTDIQISDADPATPGVMRISSASSQFAPIEFTVPRLSLSVIAANPNANVQVVSVDPEFTGTFGTANTAPVLDPISDQRVNDLAAIAFTATATDVDVPAQTLIYTLSGSVPAGAAIDSVSGSFSWTPTEAQAPGTYTFNVEVSDGDLSDTQEVTITLSVVYLTGTGADDTIVVTPGETSHQVSINGIVTSYDAALVDTVRIDGLGGSDRITIVGTDENEMVTLEPGTVGVAGQTYQIQAVNFEDITVDGGNGDDQVTMTGSDGLNRFYSYAEYARLSDSPSTFAYRVNGFETVTVEANGTGVYQAYFYDTPEEDKFVATPIEATFTRGFGTTDETQTITNGFERVYAYSSGGGDTATLYSTSGNDKFYLKQADATVVGDGFYSYAKGFTVTINNTDHAGGVDLAYIYDSAGDDTFVADSNRGTMTWEGGGGFDLANLAKVYAYSSGGNDTATLYSTSGNDKFYLKQADATVASEDFYSYAKGFAVTINNTDHAGGVDLAYMYDSAGDDTFVADSNRGTMTWEGGGGFDLANLAKVYAYSSGGNDTATLYSTSGNDKFYLKQNDATVAGDGFYSYAKGFTVTINNTDHAGGVDLAYMYDSAGDDTFVADSNRGTMTWEGGGGFDLANLAKVYAYSSGGNDTATLYSTSGNDKFYLKQADATVASEDFYSYAKGFAVTINNTDHAGGVDLAYMYDSAGDDTFVADSNRGTMTWEGGGGFDLANLAKVYAYSSGGNDTATLYSTSGNDKFYLKQADATVVGDGFYSYAKGFAVTINNTDHAGGVDLAYMYDSAGDDTFVADSNRGTMTWEGGGGFDLANLAKVYAYSSGGNDTATLYSTSGNDKFYLKQADATVVGDGFYSYAKGFTVAINNTEHLGGADLAYMYDSAGDDTFVADSNRGTMTWEGGGGFDLANLAKVYAYSSGGNDTATLYSTSGNDKFYLKQADATVVGDGFYSYAKRFTVTINNTDHAGGVDLAYMYDSAGDDTFVADSNRGTMTWEGGGGFDLANLAKVYAYSSGGNDTATLYSTSGNDKFYLKQADATVVGDGFYSYAKRFTVTINNTDHAGGVDLAYMYDSAGNDTFVADSNRGTMTWEGGGGFDLANLAKVYAYSSGGNDTATLVGSPGNDKLISTPTYVQLQGDNFYSYASGFDVVDVAAAGGSDNVGYFYDSTGRDEVHGDSMTTAVDYFFDILTGFNANVITHGFQRIYADFRQGGNDLIELMDDLLGGDRFFGSGAGGYMTDDSNYWIYLLSLQADDTARLTGEDPANKGTVDAASIDYVLQYDDYWEEM